MLSCKHLSSGLVVDRLWRAASAGQAFGRPLTCVQGYFQRCHFGNANKMTGVDDDLKKKTKSKRRKTATPLWLPKSADSALASSSQVICRAYSSSGHLKAVEALGEVGEMLSTNDSGLVHAVCEEGKSTFITDMTVENTVEIPNADIREEAKMDISIGTDSELVLANDCSSISIEVGSLMRFVKGKHGFTQRQIEEEAGVKIIFPSTKEDTCIVIESTSTNNLLKASEKIRNILEEAARSPNLDYSHFVSLPLAIHGDLVEKLTMFQDSIVGEAGLTEVDNPGSCSDDCSDDDDNRKIEKNSASVSVNLKVLEEGKHIKVELGEKSAHRALSDLGIDRSIFIKPKTFHLTVLMLKLYNKERLSLAADVLEKISKKVNDALDNRPIFIKLKGLACMRGSPRKASVVYAPVEEIGGEGRLTQACRVIIDAYLESGLILKEDAKRTLKLHATLMNVRHRKRNKKKRAPKFDSFDATGIFQKYGTEEWGEYHIREAHLSQRFKFDEYGYYHCCTSIPFPEQMQVD